MKRRIGSYFYSRRTSASEISRRRWNVWEIAGKVLRRLCLILGGIMLFSILMGLIVGTLVSRPGSSSLPDSMVLTLNITQPIGENQHSRTLTAPLKSAGMTVEDFVALMDRASVDKRVHGLVVNLDDAGMELSHIQELRKAIHRFRKSGKFAYIYTASFGDLGSGIGAYYFASAFDEIWMQPVGLVALSGLSIEMPFAKEALNKVGANPEFLHREEYKSAMESFTNSHMSEPNREMTRALLNDFSGQLMMGITEDRKLKESQFVALLNKGLITGPDAVKAGLVDKLEHSDVLMDELLGALGKKHNGKEPEEVWAEDYYDSTLGRDVPLNAANVALIHVSGEIIPGNEAEPGYATGGYIASAIRDAAEQKNIKAIVIRVNSPGGSPSASETIRRAVVYAKEEGKKVYVSMGPLAASGGYWLTVDADRIFALPTTITGSIGVIMGKFEISKLWDKLGVNWEALSWGENARLWSANKPLDVSGKAALNYAIDSTYNAFLERVAHGRNMPLDEVRAVAKGRAWSGLQAKKNGLVDDLGGLDDVMEFAAKEMKVPGRKRLRVIVLPEPLSPIQELMHLMGEQVSLADFDLKSLSFVRPYLKQVGAMERMGPIQAYDPSLPVIRP